MNLPAALRRGINPKEIKKIDQILFKFSYSYIGIFVICIVAWFNNDLKYEIRGFFFNAGK